MTDLTKITTPFGLLDPETQEALRKWDGGIQIYEADGRWYDWDPSWTFSNVYRARPAPLVADTICWEHVAPEWKWMARDESGWVYIFTGKPIMSAISWIPSGDEEYARIEGVLSSYRRGTVAWQYSLVQRP